MTVRATLEGIRVELGGRRVLDDVSLEVGAREFVTLLGPSGSGKTTTLNVLAGFVRQSAGHIRFDGAVADEVPPERRDIGFVFQSYALFPHMTVGQNVAFPLRARHVPRSERARRAGEALELVRLGGFAERRVRSLSGGQQQRVALARALVFRPRVLLLDEPLAALDQGLRQAMQLELKRIQADAGVTAISVTHDQSEALTLSDRVAVLRDGCIDQVGTPQELYRTPRTLFVAGFLGESNLVDLDHGRLVGFDVRLPERCSGLAVLRPEDLGVVEAGASGSGGCRAAVESLTFQGARYRLVARSAQTQRLITVSIGAHEDVSLLTRGAEVTLTCLDPGRVHVIEAAAAADGEAGGLPTPGGPGDGVTAAS